MEDGRAQLADGTRYEKRTTEDFGADGYWLRTTVMRGVSAGGKVCLVAPQQLHVAGRRACHDAPVFEVIMSWACGACHQRCIS